MSTPTVPFTPGDIALQSFTFLSFARTGLAAAVTGLTEWDRFHAGVDVKVPVLGDQQPKGDATVRLAVRGPGDVRALDPAQVIRTYPPADMVGAEPNYLAHVEFDRPDLPWMFTPYPESPKLPPWLALVVLRQTRCEPEASRPGFVPVMNTFMSELQSLTDSWAWAHVQLLGRTGDPAKIRDGLTDEYGLANLSRLLCPRHLDPQNNYQACVVPAFEIGRLAALGEPLPDHPSGPGVQPLAAAWTRSPGDDDVRITLPVFSSWRFTTGEQGDFEELAERLHPQVAPWYVGRLLVDSGQAFGEPGPGRLGVVEGPLVSPEAPDASSHEPTEARAAGALAHGWPTALVDGLRGTLNYPADAGDIPPGDGDDGPIPRIGPPIYADRHTGRRRVLEGAERSWFGQLNLQPRHRIVAGLGTRVVQRDQDLLMQAAWSQLADLREVNTRISQGQLAQVIGNSLFERHVSKLAYGDLLQVTRPTQGELEADTPDRSVKAALNASSTADAASTAAFRRLGAAGEPGQLLAPAGQPADFRRPYDDRWLTGQPDDTITLQFIKPIPTWQEFNDSMVGGNLGLVKTALPADPATDPAKSAALLRPLGALALFDGESGRKAKTKILEVTDSHDQTPTDAEFRDRVLEKLTPQDLKDAAVQEFDVEDPILAGAVKIFVEPEKVVDLFKKVDVSFVAEAIREDPEVDLRAFSEAAGEVLQQLAGPGQVVIVIGSRGETGTGVDVVVVGGESGETGVNVVVVGPGRVGIPGGRGVQARNEAGGVAFLRADVGFEVEVETLTQLELPQEVLAELALPNPSDEAIAQLAPGCLDDSQLGGLVLEHAPDDVLAAWFKSTGVLDDDVLTAFVNGCFEEPTPDPDQRIIDAVLAWLARRQLPGDDIAELCGLQLWEFLQNALWVHQSIPPIPVSNEYRDRLRALYADLVNLTWPGTPVREPFLVRRDDVVEQLAPTITVPKAVGEQLSQQVEWVSPDDFTDGQLHSMDVTPVFERPMHEALEAYDPDWLLPGMSRIPASDLITVVESNPAFVESFLIGLNHEMAREFLWRGFPADLRGTYFHRFWSHLDELGELASFTDDHPLGEHVSGQTDRLLVLVVRGELVRRYPDLIAVAVRADGVQQEPGPGGEVLRRPTFAGGGQAAPVVLQRHREPDVLMVGFALTPEEVEVAATQAPDTQWWFLLAEHPAAPRFGLDVDDDPSWETFPTPLGFLDGAAGPAAGWGEDSAHDADVLLRDPVRAAFPIWPLIQSVTPRAGGPV